MKIFIIDDDRLSIFLTEQTLLLEDAALEIETFFMGTDALEILRNTAHVPDILLLDINMPLMDGWDFLEALTADASDILKKCQIYLLTSSLDVSDIEKAKTYACLSGFLRKPLLPADIKLILAKHQQAPRREGRDM